MSPSPLVVTGVGLLTAHGLDPVALAGGLTAGKAPLTPLDAAFAGLGCGRAARVDVPWERVRDLPGARPLRPATMTRYTFLAVAATGLALLDSALAVDGEGLTDREIERRATFLGSYVNIPPIDKYARLALALSRPEAAREGRWEADYARLGPELKRFGGFEFLALMNSMPTAHATIQARCRGPFDTVIGTAAAGLQAIGRGVDCLADGEADRVLAGGVGSGVNQSVIMVRHHARHLAPPPGPTDRGGAPFDRASTGMVPGEAGAVLVLETEEAATGRGARPRARVLGWGTAFVAAGPGREVPDSPAGIVHAVEEALAASGLAAVDLVVATGSGLPALDALEWTALARVLGPDLGGARLCCPTAATGFTEAAHGALAAGIAVRVLCGELPVPPAPRPLRPFPGWDHALATPADRPVRTALVLSAAPDGNAAAMVFGAAGRV